LQLGDSVLTVNNGGFYGGSISANTGTGGLIIAGGTLKLSPYQAQSPLLGTLSITDGQLDVNNGHLYVDDTAGSAATIIGYITSGYDHGAQNGTGIISSAALSQPGTALGYNDSGSVLEIMYTWYGDLNLDGVVNGADIMAFNSGDGSDWAEGDLNYDGVKNADDMSLLLLGLAESGGEYISAVPEPAMLSALALPFIFGLRRRRRCEMV
jgi:hypothetical protein